MIRCIMAEVKNAIIEKLPKPVSFGFRQVLSLSQNNVIIVYD